MTRSFAFASLAALALAGCADGGLKVRSVGLAHTDTSDGTTSGRVGIGLGHLAMGNVALALESFRRASREDPNSAEALAGMAECYRQMGRAALARQFLEQAMALRPDEPKLYTALAVLAVSEGKLEESYALRREAARRSAGPAKVVVDLPPARPPAAAPAHKPVSAPTVTVDLAPAEPVALPDVGPRLVRLSLGEVMLLTKSGNAFADRRPDVRIARDDTIHAPLRVLNAARIQGIAARTREMLAMKGIRGVEIGNAPGRRMTSELRYAAGERQRAAEVAANLPFRVMMVERAGPLVLLVGRDAGRPA